MAILSSSSVPKSLLLSTLLLLGCLALASANDFYRDTSVYFGGSRARILNGGTMMALNLDRGSGSGFQSKNRYLYGRFSMQIKLVGGNSAGTVSCFYLRSQGAAWEEIDFEFLGNVSGQPYKIHTNVYTNGVGNREQQFFPWFDPTAAFHTYTILWNPNRIVWYIDNIPIREFRNLESMGVPFPKTQPMYMYASLWDAEDWATRGGAVKTDWSKAPFVASFTNYVADSCVVGSGGANACFNAGQWYNQQLDITSQQRLRWIQDQYMVYNFCKDYRRFPQGFPRECSVLQ